MGTAAGPPAELRRAYFELRQLVASRHAGLEEGLRDACRVEVELHLRLADSAVAGQDLPQPPANHASTTNIDGHPFLTAQSLLRAADWFMCDMIHQALAEDMAAFSRELTASAKRDRMWWLQHLESLQGSMGKSLEELQLTTLEDSDAYNVLVYSFRVAALEALRAIEADPITARIVRDEQSRIVTTKRAVISAIVVCCTVFALIAAQL